MKNNPPLSKDFICGVLWAVLWFVVIFVTVEYFQRRYDDVKPVQRIEHRRIKPYYFKTAYVKGVVK